MDARTAKALEKSIKHWETVVKNPEVTLVRRSRCALCQLFNTDRPPAVNCKGCPVADRVGDIYCRDTPLKNFLWGTTVENAQAELDFLISLREAKKSKKRNKKKDIRVGSLVVIEGLPEASAWVIRAVDNPSQSLIGNVVEVAELPTHSCWKVRGIGEGKYLQNYHVYITKYSVLVY